MFLVLIACSALQQKGPLTTPIDPPKPAPAKASPAAKEKSEPAKLAIQGGSLLPDAYVDKGGFGPRSSDGDTVTVHFLVKLKNGSLIADSKKRGLPFTFTLGASGSDRLLNVVAKGMKVGAVRTAMIPVEEVYSAGDMPVGVTLKDTLTVILTLLRRSSP